MRQTSQGKRKKYEHQYPHAVVKTIYMIYFSIRSGKMGVTFSVHFSTTAIYANKKRLF